LVVAPIAWQMLQTPSTNHHSFFVSAPVGQYLTHSSAAFCISSSTQDFPRYAELRWQAVGRAWSQLFRGVTIHTANPCNGNAPASVRYQALNRVCELTPVAWQAARTP